MSLVPQRLLQFQKKLDRSLRGEFKKGYSIARRKGWSFAIQSYQDCLAVANGCWFDRQTAEAMANFFPVFLRHSKGRQWAGKPFGLLNWERRGVIEPLFGWKRSDGTRRYRRGYVSVPKKNGKSTLAAGIALALLVPDQEPGAEVYCAATAREQASITWTEAARMVKASPELRSILTVHDHVKTIHYPRRNAYLKALSAEAKVHEGINIHGLIADELHAWVDRQFWDALYYGGETRMQPLQLAITTAGSDLQSICREEYEYAKMILSGALDNWEYFALIYEADKDDDPGDPRTWRKANPSMGVLFREEDFARDWEEVQGKPAVKSRFLRYRLNIWVQQYNPWIDIELWDICADAEMSFDAIIKGERT